jgi:hypothetical protein
VLEVMLILGSEESRRFSNPVLNVRHMLTDWLLQHPQVQSPHFSPQLLQNFGCVTLIGLVNTVVGLTVLVPLAALALDKLRQGQKRGDR